jgi:hypothetical protein
LTVDHGAEHDRGVPRVAVAACACCLAVLTASTDAQQSSKAPPELAVLLARAADAADAWVTGFSAIVAQERYVQNKDNSFRYLQSDILLVRLKESGELFLFRDVSNVDNRDVRDRQDRLSRLFLDSPGSALEQATAIDRAGAQYDLRPERLIDPSSPTSGPRPMVNSPFAAMAFLQSRYQSRFRFTLTGPDRSGLGPDVWIVAYEEHQRPTVFGSVTDGPHKADVVAKGRFWIHSTTGRVSRTGLRLDYLSRNRDTVITSFRHDEALQLTVPVDMRTEHYFASAGLVRGTATYGRFRRFTVRTDERIEPATPSRR